MRKEELALLAEKIEEGSATEKELALYIGACEALHSSFLQDAGHWPEIQNDLPAMEAASLQKFWARQKPVDNKSFPLWKKISTIAAAVAAITLGIWLYYTNEITSSQSASLNNEIVQNDIAPGRNTATLTFANGNVITLDTNRASVIVTDSVKTLTMLTASTPRGGTYMVELPDGSKVWLNADSKISFPSRFNGQTRQIELSGEAYVEVTKDKARPFIVKTDKQLIKVLGTHFNINAYADEAVTKTTLLEGSVKVTSTSSFSSASSRETRGTIGHASSVDASMLRDGKMAESIILKPNQQASVGNNKITITEVDANASVAWKNGEFYLDEMDFKTAMRQIARWYDVTISYEDNIEENLKTGGWISRNENLSAVLQSIERAGPIRFKIEGKKILVYNR